MGADIFRFFRVYFLSLKLFNISIYRQHIHIFFRHMKEHMYVPIDTSNMSEQELQFHYFKMHDSDGNNKLGNITISNASTTSYFYSNNIIKTKR